MSSHSPGSGSWNWMAKLGLGAAVVIVVLLGGLVVLNAINYSVGTRTGTLDKLSSKGLTCWTTEGQLALPNFSRQGTLRSREQTSDNTFYFSVPDKKVRAELEAIAPGSPVTVEYHQKLFVLAWPIPFLCRRRTQYEVVGVKPAPEYKSEAPYPARP